MIIRILFLKSCAVILRMLGHILDNYQLIAFILFFISTTGPHMRIGSPFNYDGSISCVHLGSRGFVATETIPDCPLFAILNSAKEKPRS